MNHHQTTVSVEAVIPTRGLIGFRDRPGEPDPRRRHHEPSFQGVRAEARGNSRPASTGCWSRWRQAMRPALRLTTSKSAGRLFISPGEAIYAGMVVGENSRPDDMAVNPCKAKALTNMRSQGDGKGIQLDTPIKMSLERALEYIGADEFVEATPTSAADAEEDSRRGQAPPRREQGLGLASQRASARACGGGAAKGSASISSGRKVASGRGRECPRLPARGHDAHRHRVLRDSVAQPMQFARLGDHARVRRNPGKRHSPCQGRPSGTCSA